MNLEEMRLDSAIKQQKGLHFILASVIIWDCRFSYPFDRIANPDEKPADILFYGSPDAAGIHDFKNHQSGLHEQGKSTDEFGDNIFCKPNPLFADCNVDPQCRSRKNGNDLSYDFWSAFAAIRLAV